MKIGITIGLKTNTDSIWTNGIKLNVLIFYKLLKQSSRGYEVYLLNTLGADLTTKPDYLRDIPVYPCNEKIHEMDLVFLMGAQVEDKVLAEFRSQPDKRIVSYRCGNDYMLFAESVLLGSGDRKPYRYEKVLDECWYIPQQHETNAGFYRTMHRVNTLTVPFVWDKKYILGGLVDIHQGFKAGKYAKDYGYQPSDQKVIGIMEPNLNVIKFCMIPLMVAEESYRGPVGKQHIRKVMLTNAEKLGTNKEFMDVVKSFDLYADKKITAESRYQTAFFMSQYADVLISHQVVNPLNYLYLDCAYMGYPLLHNAPMVRDLAYYYEGGDTVEGARQLDDILLNHDSRIEEYNQRNRTVLHRYESTNPDLIETYDRLIDGLFNGGNHNLSYNTATNLYQV
jgi:hypothetical protein